jgi:hypothetical protein
MPVSMLANAAMEEAISAGADDAAMAVIKDTLLKMAAQSLDVAKAAGIDIMREKLTDDLRHVLDTTFIGLIYEQGLIRDREMSGFEQMLLGLGVSLFANRPQEFRHSDAVVKAQMMAMSKGKENGELEATHVIVGSIMDMMVDQAKSAGAPEDVARTPAGFRLLDLMLIGALYERDML